MKKYKAAVIGGGISGIQASLDIANAGFEVFLIEKEPTIGGQMAKLSETFPTLDCSQCILTPKMVEVKQHPNIRLFTYSEILEATHNNDTYHLKILKKPKFVKEGVCTVCDDCVPVCPVAVSNEFDRGLTLRKAIYIPFPQAVPSIYTLDIDACLGLNPLICGKCKDACEANAIDFDMKPEIIDIEADAIVLATGYELYKPVNEYGYGRYEDVIDGLEFERLLSASGPTSGEIIRPSDKTVPKEVVFIQCVGSRTPDNGLAYCSKICCMYTAKHAMLYKHKVHDGSATVFYMDIRAAGKNYKEFIERTKEEGVSYIRGRVSKVFKRGKKLIVWGADTISRKKYEVAADLVVLACAIIPREETKSLAEKLGVEINEYGYLQEKHQNFAPFETKNKGIFLAGCASAPKDIPDSVMQGSAAAGKVIADFCNGRKNSNGEAVMIEDAERVENFKK